ncbi:[LysW]-lysine hydrolase [Candidatus Thermoflexus japonica]|uniref:Putative [LysW]-lysine hydrolase n=1 Tax=Candidatus Thermoflexus japonica TaxID=2035417 RepID=A0A2H5Y393_9CHLR|nr:[LysW]-lysine hydrolase [Candidatus Thermoflexus japonica]
MIPAGDPEAIALLEALVRLPSPSGAEGEAAAFLTGWMAGHGFEAGVDEAGNAVGKIGEGPRTLLLLGHLDTVPGEIPVRVENDRLYGRGAVDAKGPLAAATVAAARVGARPGWRWVVVGAVEEEAATSRGARHLLRTWSPPDMVLILEPSGADAITLGYKGRMLLHLRLEAPNRHTAIPEPNPAERLVDLWLALRERARAASPGNRIFEQITPSIRRMMAEGDGLREWAEMTVGFRLPEAWPPERWRETIRPVLEAAGASWWTEGEEPAWRASADTPLVRALLAGIRGEGLRPRLLLKSGTSDMNVVGPAWRCPIAAYGPGDARLDHTPDEHIELKEYLTGIRVLTRALEWIAAHAPA